METVGDLLARECRGDRTALEASVERRPRESSSWRRPRGRTERRSSERVTGRTYDYHWLCTTAWKAGNFLRHTGVRRGVTVGAVGEGPLALLAVFGTALLEGAAWIDPPRWLADESDLRTLVAPTTAVDAYRVPRSAQRVGYGEEPAEPDVRHFEADLWSENPSFPPVERDPDAPLLVDGARSHSSASAFAAARAVVADVGIGERDRVVVNGSLGDPRVFVAGVLAPLIAGGTVVLADDGGDAGTGTDADVFPVALETAEGDLEPIDPATVDLPGSADPGGRSAVRTDHDG